MSERSVFVVYVVRDDRIHLLGPIRWTREEAEEKRDEYKRQGWEGASWVELGEHGPYILT